TQLRTGSQLSEAGGQLANPEHFHRNRIALYEVALDLIFLAGEELTALLERFLNSGQPGTSTVWINEVRKLFHDALRSEDVLDGAEVAIFDGFQVALNLLEICDRFHQSELYIGTDKKSRRHSERQLEDYNSGCF